MTEDPKPVNAESKGKFWGALLGTTLLCVGGSGALSTTIGQSSTEDAKAAAKTQAAEETKRMERAVAIYLDALRPEIEQELDDITDDVKRLDVDLKKCLKLAREADKQAFAALLAIEIRHGRRVAVRALEMANDEEPDPEPEGPPAPRVRKSKAKLPSYHLRIEGD